MSLAKDKTSITTVLPIDVKNRLQEIAKLKKWTLSQTSAELIQTYLDEWERHLGIESASSSKKSIQPKSKS